MPKKLNNNKSGAAQRHKERKRNEAESRQKKYDSLSYQEKRDLIESRPGKSTKEILRLKNLSV
jgi:hypothetical protein